MAFIVDHGHNLAFTDLHPNFCMRACADPESFARGGPTQTTFVFCFVFCEDPNTAKVGHHRPASETPF